MNNGELPSPGQDQSGQTQFPTGAPSWLNAEPLARPSFPDVGRIPKSPFEIDVRNVGQTGNPLTFRGGDVDIIEYLFNASFPGVGLYFVDYLNVISFRGGVCLGIFAAGGQPTYNGIYVGTGSQIATDADGNEIPRIYSGRVSGFSELG